MKVLVTGAAGFIGSHLSEALLSRGYSVVGLDNFDPFYDPQLKEENLRKCADHSAFTLVRGDILDHACLARTFDDHDVNFVVHLAAKAGVRPSLKDPLSYQRVNMEGTLNILEQMRNRGISKLIFASSSSVYGNNEKVPYSETDIVDYAISPYAATKKAGEVLTHTYYHLYGIQTTCLRFFTVYGPRQRPEMAIRYFTDRIYNEKPLTLFGNGKSLRDYTYIDDIVSGICASMDHIGGYHILNLGEHHTTALIDLVRLIENAVGKKAMIDFQPEQPGDVIQTYADISKAQKLIGYRPVTVIEDGVRRFVAWYIEQQSRRIRS